jgi:hypothetical protein
MSHAKRQHCLNRSGNWICQIVFETVGQNVAVADVAVADVAVDIVVVVAAAAMLVVDTKTSADTMFVVDVQRMEHFAVAYVIDENEAIATLNAEEKEALDFDEH